MKRPSTIHADLPWSNVPPSIRFDCSANAASFPRSPALARDLRVSCPHMKTRRMICQASNSTVDCCKKCKDVRKHILLDIQDRSCSVIQVAPAYWRT
ncbi:unnamed protein product [Mycena citricolor]|uniref:Uncharacterized protein n=1 Tax=Mycena citricolor TaxID=2018698 RepID=A0AAD2HH37_9AGAR|nr:unnamed protein product [Mycena citricolor]